MNVLGKILEEIDKKRESLIDMSNDEPELCDVEEWFNEGVDNGKIKAYCDAMEIIRSHMDEGFNISVTQWIPYTVENMPKKEGLYLVTCDGEKYPVKRMRFKNGIWLWNYGIYDGKILAWQPLPEPYKPEEGQLCQR